MVKNIQTNDHLTLKKGNPRIVRLRAKNLGKNMPTSIERPFSILSEEQKNEVIQYCVHKALRFYTSSNDKFR